MRRDAERNREKLVAAASEMMRSEGGDVPMELIADRAGLTRGTLYRNFPHRQAMYEAVLESDLKALTDQLAKDGEAEPLAFLRRLTDLMSVYDKFLIALAAMPDYDAAKNQKRMAAAIADPLAAAQRKGLLRADLTGEDILMASRMLASHLRLDDPADIKEAFARRMELIMRGLAQSSSPDPTGKPAERSIRKATAKRRVAAATFEDKAHPSR